MSKRNICDEKGNRGCGVNLPSQFVVVLDLLTGMPLAGSCEWITCEPGLAINVHVDDGFNLLSDMPRAVPTFLFPDLLSSTLCY